MSIALKYCSLTEGAAMFVEAGVSANDAEARKDIAAAVRDRQLHIRFPEMPDLPGSSANAEVMAFEVNWGESTILMTTRSGWGRSWKSINGGRRPVRIELVRAEIEDLIRRNAPQRASCARTLSAQTRSADLRLAERLVKALAAHNIRHTKESVLDYCRRNGCPQLSK